MRSLGPCGKGGDAQIASTAANGVCFPSPAAASCGAMISQPAELEDLSS